MIAMKLIHLLQTASAALHASTRTALERLFAASVPVPGTGFDHGIDPP
jgi:hypothetical protein